MRGSNPDYIKMLVDKLDKRRERRNTVFTGEYVEIPIDNEVYKSYRRNTIFLISILALLHIGSGFINNPGMFEFYIAISYVIALFSLIYFISILFQLPKEKNKFRLGEVGLVFYRLRISSIFLGISLVFSVIGEIVFISFVSIGHQLNLDFNFLAFKVFELLFVYFLIRNQIRIIKKMRIK